MLRLAPAYFLQPHLLLLTNNLRPSYISLMLPECGMNSPLGCLSLECPVTFCQKNLLIFLKPRQA